MVKFNGDRTISISNDMFREMMDGRELSQRSLPKEIDVSEGTIRNALLYAEAAEAHRLIANNAVKGNIVLLPWAA